MQQQTVTETLLALADDASTDDAPSSEEVIHQLVPLVYDELRRLAHGQLVREHGRVTLQTTGLVHEAYLKLVDHSQVSKNGRAYFFGAAVRAMRQVLVDAARHRNRQKRGSGVRPLTLDESVLAIDGFAAEVLDLEEALQGLAVDFPRQAKVVECRFYGGLSVEETAEVLSVSSRTVKGDWALARAWLFATLKASP